MLFGELASPLGEIVDISATGMQVRCKSSMAPAKGETASFELTGGEYSFAVTGIVRWVARPWFGARESTVGVEFVPSDHADRVRFEKIASWAASGADGPPPEGSRRTATSDAEMPDLYALLGVAHDASTEAIRHAFRRVASVCHPDRNPGPEAAQRFTEYSKAYRVLRDAQLRERYDTMLRAERSKAKTRVTAA